LLVFVHLQFDPQLFPPEHLHPDPQLQFLNEQPQFSFSVHLQFPPHLHLHPQLLVSVHLQFDPHWHLLKEQPQFSLSVHLQFPPHLQLHPQFPLEQLQLVPQAQSGPHLHLFESILYYYFISNFSAYILSFLETVKN